VTITDADGAVAQAVSWGIAVEVPVQVSLNGVPWTVMLATPAYLGDLAIGLAVTERVLCDAGAVRDVLISEFLNDVAVDVLVPETALDRSALRSRALQGNSACGFCGLESLAQLTARRADAATGESRAPGISVTDAAVLAAFADLPRHQPLNAATRSMHAAAWCQVDGAISLVREDVGRHNALDKLVGALARQGRLAQPGFIVMSSRCSYELVYKAAAAHTLLLATISAPTSMALEWARELAVPVACRIDGGTGGRIARFDGGEVDGG
jgi:FdhD protein